VVSNCLAPNVLVSWLQGNTIQNLFPCVCRTLPRLPLKNEYKYLGFTFQRNGSYSTHIQKVVAKCRARLIVIRMLKGTSWGAGKRLLLTVYRSLVRSVIMVWRPIFSRLPVYKNHYKRSEMMHCACVLEPWSALQWFAFITRAMRRLWTSGTSSCAWSLKPISCRSVTFQPCS